MVLVVTVLRQGEDWGTTMLLWVQGIMVRLGRVVASTTEHQITVLFPAMGISATLISHIAACDETFLLTFP